MSLTETIRRRLKEAIAYREVTVLDVAREIDVHPNTLYSFLSGNGVHSNVLDKVWGYVK